jgi:hypothetical protein
VGWVVLGQVDLGWVGLGWFDFALGWMHDFQVSMCDACSSYDGDWMALWVLWGHRKSIMCWVGLDFIELKWVGWYWVRLTWVGLDWVGLISLWGGCMTFKFRCAMHVRHTMVIGWQFGSCEGIENPSWVGLDGIGLKWVVVYWVRLNWVGLGWV